MSFIRAFDEKRCNKVKESKMWEKILLPDIKAGQIFPAIRDEKLYFYYNGGVLFTFEGNSFKYNTEYFKHVYRDQACPFQVKEGNYTLDKIEKEIGKDYFFNDLNYDLLKKGIDKKFQCSIYPDSEENNSDKERKYLKELYSLTYGVSKNREPKVIVLDIEIRFNVNDKKKCDMILYNMERNELMLVEAKLSGNPELKSNTEKVKVFQQMDNYNSWIEKPEDREEFVKQYKNYITIVSDNLNILPYKIQKDSINTLKMRDSVKLFIAEGNHSFQENYLPKICDHLGKENVCYFDESEKSKITPEEIWYRSE
ncbi:MAG: hypothetical protein K0S47_3794 [Herbinix sp.]|jgi:hypothetical protein|nr:hypothetical protein [Herbinix sp.]